MNISNYPEGYYASSNNTNSSNNNNSIPLSPSISSLYPGYPSYKETAEPPPSANEFSNNSSVLSPRSRNNNSSNNISGLNMLSARNRTVSAPTTPNANNINFPFTSVNPIINNFNEQSNNSTNCNSTNTVNNVVSSNNRLGVAGFSARLGSKRKSPIPLKITIEQPNNDAHTNNTNNNINNKNTNRSNGVKPIITATPTSTPYPNNTNNSDNFINNSANKSGAYPHITRTPINTPLPRDDEDFNSSGNLSLVKPGRSVSIGFNDLNSNSNTNTNVNGLYNGIDGGSVTAPNTPAVPNISPTSNVINNNRYSNSLTVNGLTNNIGLPPRSPVNSPATGYINSDNNAIPNNSTFALQEYKQLASQGNYSAPPNSAIGDSMTTPRGIRYNNNSSSGMFHDLQSSPKTPINTPRVSFVASPNNNQTTLTRQQSAPLHGNNNGSSSVSATPLNSPLPYTNIKNTKSNNLTSTAHTKTPLNTPSFGPMSPNATKVLRNSNSNNPSTTPNPTPRTSFSVTSGSIPFMQPFQTPQSIKPQPDPTINNKSQLNNTSNKSRPAHTRAPSTINNSITPSTDDLARLAVLNQGINVPTIQATLSVPNELVEELKVRPKGDDVEYDETDEPDQELLNEYEPIQQQQQSPKHTSTTNKIPKVSFKDDITTIDNKSNNNDDSNTIDKSIGNVDGVMNIPFSYTPSISWLLVLTRKLLLQSIITQQQHKSLKNAILDANPTLLQAFHNFQQTNNKEILVQTLLKFLPTHNNTENDDNNSNNNVCVLSLDYDTSNAFQSEIRKSTINKYSIQELWVLFKEFVPNKLLTENILIQLLQTNDIINDNESLQLFFIEIFNILSSIIGSGDSNNNISTGLYLSILSTFARASSINEKLKFIFMLLDESGNGYINIHTVYNYLFGLISIIKLVSQSKTLNVPEQTKLLFNNLLQNTFINSSNQQQHPTINQHQFCDWESNPIQLLQAFLNKLWK